MGLKETRGREETEILLKDSQGRGGGGGGEKPKGGLLISQKTKKK